MAHFPTKHINFVTKTTPFIITAATDIGTNAGPNAGESSKGTRKFQTTK